MSPRTLYSLLSFNALVVFFLVALGVLLRRPASWIFLLTVFAGAFIGMASVWSNEIIVPVFLLLAFAAFASFACPQRAFILAGLLALWVPVFTALAAVSGAVSAQPGVVLQSCIAFVPALAGSVLGFGINRAAGRPTLVITFL